MQDDARWCNMMMMMIMMILWFLTIEPKITRRSVTSSPGRSFFYSRWKINLQLDWFAKAEFSQLPKRIVHELELEHMHRPVALSKRYMCVRYICTIIVHIHIHTYIRYICKIHKCVTRKGSWAAVSACPSQYPVWGDDLSLKTVFLLASQSDAHRIAPHRDPTHPIPFHL